MSRIVTSIWPVNAGQYFHQRRLSRAILSDEPHDLSGRRCQTRPNPARRRRENAWRFPSIAVKERSCSESYGRGSLMPCSGSWSWRWGRSLWRNSRSPCPSESISLARESIPIFYGLMTEEINFSYDGGLYAELIRNRTFRDNPQSPVNWSVAKYGGGEGAISLDNSPVPNTALTTALKLDATSISASNVWAPRMRAIGVSRSSRTRHTACRSGRRRAANFKGPSHRIDREQRRKHGLGQGRRRGNHLGVEEIHRDAQDGARLTPYSCHQPVRDLHGNAWN